MTMEEKFEKLLKLNTENDAQLEYLRKQLELTIRIHRREVQSSHSTSESEDAKGVAEEDPNKTS